MTPQERQLIDDLFDRLAKLESAKRDPEAMSAIMQGLRNAPNAVYALVQTALVQDEALKRADMRIQELEAGAGQQDINPAASSIRCATRSSGRTSNMASTKVRCPTFARPRWRRQPSGLEHRPGVAAGPAARTIWSAGLRPASMAAQQQQPSPFGGGGGSFLGTAAAAAAGVVGGSMLAGSIRSMMGGGGNQQSFGDTAGHSGGIEDRRPWSDQSGGNLARDAGINDIGSSRPARRQQRQDSGSRQGFFDQASHDDDDIDHDSDGFDGDDGDGDSDYA